MSTFDYVVNDIDEYMENIKFNASQFGWSIFFVSESYGWTSVTVPDFFPKNQDAILESAKKAAERHCADNCKFCYYAHPMLQTGNCEFCKLCTIQVMRIFPQLFKNRKMK